MPAIVRLGNPAPQMQREVHNAEGVPTGEHIGVPAKHLNQSITSVTMRDDYADEAEVERALSTNNDRMLKMIARGLDEDLQRYAVGVLEVESLLAVHSAGASPTWVWSDDENFARALAQHFDSHLGEPMNLLTNGGRDALHKQHLDTAAQPAAFNFMAISANTTAESASNTTLPGEITTAGGGLIRAQATFAHTNGTNTSTLTKTFTANGTDSLPVVVAKDGLLNASSSGTLGYEKLLNATATLTISGDNVAITHTITAG